MYWKRSPRMASIQTLYPGGDALKDATASGGITKVSRSELIELFNQDLPREYQAIISLRRLFAGLEGC
jgi:hypothetical protein